MDHKTEQDAGLLEQAATMLEERAEEQRTWGNDSAAEGAACSAHAIRRLAPALLRAGRGCLAQIEEPAQGAKFFSASNEGLDEHETAEAAQNEAQSIIDMYREEAADGWPEEVESVCWGVILGKAVERPVEDAPFMAGILGSDMEPVDYVLEPVAAPALEAPAAPTCERCGLPPAEHDATHWCDNRSFAAAAPQAPAALDELRQIAAIAACWGCDHPDEPGDTEVVRRVKWAARQLRAVAQAPAAPILGDAERLAAARQDKSLADYWRNRVTGLAEEFTTAAEARYLADQIVSELYDLPTSGVARPAEPAAPAVDAALNALIADVRALPTLRASEIDGEESDGTPKHWRNRPFVSLRKLELLLRDRVTASSDTALLNFIAAEYLDLRSFGMPTGQGDADVGWRVIQHHMGEPTERVVAEVYKDDPRSAIRAAIARLERDPYCTGALHEEDAAQAKEGGEA